MSTLINVPDASLVARLHALYNDASKHSIYQSVPSFVARALGYQEEIQTLWRSDAPRYHYIISKLDLSQDARVADIGANTGYFSLNLANARPDVRITSYEPNPRHAEFIRLTAETFGLKNLETCPQSCDYSGLGSIPGFEAILLLNVVHHAGFDFDAFVPDDNESFSEYALNYLIRLRTHGRQLVFQVGSNRGGDKTRALFPRDDDAARLSWIARLLRGAGWRIEHIGYPQFDQSEAIVFRDVPADVIDAARAGLTNTAKISAFLRSMELKRFPGEFHRRPLVIAKAIES